MNLFKLEWCDYDMNDEYLFTHDNKTEQEFKEDVQFLLVKYGNEYIEQERGWVGANYWIKYVAPKLVELGYKEVKPIEWSFFGGSILSSENIIRNDDLKWKEIVGKELFSKAIEANSKKKFR